MPLHQRLRRHHEDGFTLVELVVTVAIVGIIVTALTGVVLEYLKTTVSTEKRFTESHDVQFASAYWQRDVASIGVHSTTYCRFAGDPGCSADHSYPFLRSVTKDGSLAACALPTGTAVVTLAWSQYDASDPSNPTKVTVTYVAAPSGARYELIRRRCTGSTVDSTVTVANNLVAVPTVMCDVACTTSGGSVPDLITMFLSVNDPQSADTTDYTATLTGERRQT